MELKIFKKKHVSFQEMLVFLIKFIFYFDTSELYTKTNKKNYQRNGKETISLFDYCFYSNTDLNKIINIINYQSGGSDISTSTNLSESEPEPEPEPEPESEPENTSSKKNKTETEEKVDKGALAFINELKAGIVKGINLIKTKLLAILTLILYASIFPAIPFFLVMTSMYATLKYIMFKFRNF